MAPPGHGKNQEASLEASRARAKARVRDIALCNRFAYFLTWTLDGKLIDRYDPEEVYSKLKNTLSNAVQRHGLQYLIVPEYHKQKTGEKAPAIHLHGLCNPGTLPLERAVIPGTDKPLFDRSGREVYNMPSWKFGFSTCVLIDQHYEKAVSYIVKYMGKSEDKIFGKWYLSSRDLVRQPEITLLAPIDYNDFVDPAKIAAGRQYEVSITDSLRLAAEELHFMDNEQENHSYETE